MPRRSDLKSILLIGSGPIVIGQACEFDYSGTQACKVLKEEGLRVVLVNSNPATIMTDPELVDATYVEPITPDVIEQVIARERPDACLPTLGGQTALNAAMELDRRGVFQRYGVELIGANPAAIATAEDRRQFREAMTQIGMDLPRSGFAYTVEEVRAVVDEIGLPVVLRGSFVLGGGGSGIASTDEELEAMAAEALAASPISEVLVEESIAGWKEYELEVMRDRRDNYVVVCSIENLDPMGVHTGDSITVAPAQTLSDAEFQAMRDAGAQIIRRIGVETGGSNIQFAVHPGTGRMVVIEMNPRVSRSSALASKATGFPIAKIAAKLAIGYTLDEIANDITLKTPACFEPSIDYVVVKVPRWAFEKFPGADHRLGTQMKSVGEAMAIGRTFPEALQKALRSLENGRAGLGHDGAGTRVEQLSASELLAAVAVPTEDRLFLLERALRLGISVEELNRVTGIDPWFLAQIEALEGLAAAVSASCAGPGGLDRRLVRRAKRAGYSDAQLGVLTGLGEAAARQGRLAAGVAPTFKTVDTCAAEFEAMTPYYYSTYEDEDEVASTGRRSVVILGSGPNRIGQGIEFDYCCVHAALAIRESGYDAVMVNCNPETVSTDYDISTRLYFEPLTFEDVLAVVEREQPIGVIVTLGGQTPLKLAVPLAAAGVPLLGTPPDAIDRAEDRGRFTALLSELGIAQAPGGIATSLAEAREVVERVGYPVLVRPSYVLGGRAMEIVYADEALERYIAHAVRVSEAHPVLIDRFLEDAVEVDVDAVCDGTDVYVGGILEHIEEAGVHSGDSACVIPPHSLAPEVVGQIVRGMDQLARALGVVGLINAQWAVRDGVVYCLEVNPRASRTVPFVGKATGVPLAKVAVRVMLGEKLAAMAQLPPRPVAGVWWGHDRMDHVAVKEAVLPFGRFPGVDTLLGPEMRSTGEVMGIDNELGLAFAKSQAAGGWALPTKGRVFVSVANPDKAAVVEPVRALLGFGFEVLSTQGTAVFLNEAGIPATPVGKFSEGSPNIVEQIMRGEVDLVVNTPRGRGPRADGYEIRTAAVRKNIPYVTTIAGIRAMVAGIESLRRGEQSVRPLQDYLDYRGRA
ncbi:MAG TPA: carbamoyl-phosphate synthase large subunit [Actinomycetota bacterium]|nr:carbamoyl-phosphate synthase large subunit [Actinomycetota bacterium]